MAMLGALGRLLDRRVLAVLVAIVIVGAIVATQVGKGNAGYGGQGGTHVAQWLTVHYASMDNNLDEYGEWQADLNSLEKVGSSPDSVHVALYDGLGPNNTVVQYVKQGGVDEYPPSVVDPTWGDELDLGNQDTLYKFIVWAATEYPAEKLCLVLNNHGGGWMGICWDDNPGTYLKPGDVASALRKVEVSLGHKVDVILTYACLMASMEVAYELRDSASYLVASETYSWGSETHGEEYLIGNYPFDKIWGPVKDDPSIAPVDLGRHIVDAFQTFGPYSMGGTYIQRDYSSDTVSLIDLSKARDLALAVDRMGSELKDSLTGLGKVLGQRQLIDRVIGVQSEPASMCTQAFSGEPDWVGKGVFVQYDLLDLVAQLEKCRAHPLCEKATLDAVKLAASAAILAERHGTDASQGQHVDAHGLSIWLPYRSTEYRPSYDTRAFAMDTSWDEFLRSIIWT